MVVVRLDRADEHAIAGHAVALEERDPAVPAREHAGGRREEARDDVVLELPAEPAGAIAVDVAVGPDEAGGARGGAPADDEAVPRVAVPVADDGGGSVGVEPLAEAAHLRTLRGAHAGELERGPRREEVPQGRERAHVDEPGVEGGARRFEAGEPDIRGLLRGGAPGAGPAEGEEERAERELGDLARDTPVEVEAVGGELAAENGEEGAGLVGRGTHRCVGGAWGVRRGRQR